MSAKRMERVRAEMGFALKVLAQACETLALAVRHYDDEVRLQETVSADTVFRPRKKEKLSARKRGEGYQPLDFGQAGAEELPPVQTWHASVPPWENPPNP